MDLPIDVDTSVIDLEVVAVRRRVNSVAFDGVETRPNSHADRNPLVIVGLDRSAGVDRWRRGRHPSHQRHHGPSN